MKKTAALVILFLSLLCSRAHPLLKQHYGGTTKIAEELTAHLAISRITEKTGNSLKAVSPATLTLRDNTLRIDLSAFPADKITELEKAVARLQDVSHPCHWILDYPYFHHEHPNSLRVEGSTLILEAEDAEFLTEPATSGCFPGENISTFTPFNKTQFGFESNRSFSGGRPFLDSIIPVAVDPVNPYLAFKLRDVDAFVIPEDRYQEISSDPQIKILPGPQYFLYFTTQNLSPEQITNLTSVINAQEISQSALNGHAEIFLPAKEPIVPGSRFPVVVVIPSESPFRLVGERVRVQLATAGFTLNSTSMPAGAPVMKLIAEPVKDENMDLVRYQTLKNL